jgi:hypothetical protein
MMADNTSVAAGSMCPIPSAKKNSGKSVMERIIGHRYDPYFGSLTDSLLATADLPIIHRSYGLLDSGKFYGPNFFATAYMKATNAFTAFTYHVALNVTLMWMAVPPVRWLLKKLVYEPGQGPTKE